MNIHIVLMQQSFHLKISWRFMVGIVKNLGWDINRYNHFSHINHSYIITKMDERNIWVPDQNFIKIQLDFTLFSRACLCCGGEELSKSEKINLSKLSLPQVVPSLKTDIQS